MRRWLVKRPNDEVIMTIMKNKCDETYSFINLTKEHICPCKFSSVEEALLDMDKKIKDGTVLKYKKIGEHMSSKDNSYAKYRQKDIIFI